MKNKEKIILKLSKIYNTPIKVQKYLKSLDYNTEIKGETLKSAYMSIQKNNCHCLEACFIAAALLEKSGYPPLVVSLESKDNLDHVIFVYQDKNKKWGSVARSRLKGLNGRKPVFISLAKLVDSYFDPYIDEAGCIVGYQIANMNDIKSDWRYSLKNVWAVEQYLINLKHIKIKKDLARYKKFYARFKLNIKLPRKIFWL
jgi:hypothetical protein